jgi:hypothetical protein
MGEPVSVREAARKILSDPTRSQELIVQDFEAVVHWSKSQSPSLHLDRIRDKLVKRKALLDAALPESLGSLSSAALSIVERGYLQKKYVNSETMYGDKVEDIPQANFFVSEDNYAWDMDELAKAIDVNGGVMRNPLSRELFCESDIRMIVEHPLGKRLKPLQEAQNRMKKGFRSSTISWVEKLGGIMLNDQSNDAGPSRKAINEFLAYVVTLPQLEQQTINSLKIPARDSRTRQAFDYTIGESVRDAKANTTCFHKVRQHF